MRKRLAILLALRLTAISIAISFVALVASELIARRTPKAARAA